MNSRILLYGGLANQMFQYMYGLTLKNKGVTINYDITLNARIAKTTDLYNLEELFQRKFLIRNQAREFEALCGYAIWRISRKIIHCCNDSVEEFKLLNNYLGYYQDYRLYNVLTDDQKAEFVKPFRNTGTPFKQGMIHIRLGDYERSNVKKIMSLVTSDYYVQSIKYLKEQYGVSSFDVYSNDMIGALNLIKNISKEVDASFQYIKLDSAILEMRKMSNYKYAIIPNSTFSWWPTFLGNAKEICAPIQWYKLQECKLYHPRIKKIKYDYD